MAQKVVIVGNGISGVTAARYIRKRSDASITIVSSESPHFFARTALMYAYMGSIRDEDLKPYENEFWGKNRIELVHDYAIRANTVDKTVLLSGGRQLQYDVLILATGSKSASPGWEGDTLPGVQGFYSLQDLALIRENTGSVQNAVVVGGGLTGVEVAEMLVSRGISVTFLVRENGYMDYVLPRVESELIGREIKRHGVDLRLGTSLARIVEGESGRVSSVETTDGKTIAADFVAITTGVQPNTDLAVGSGIATQKGILVNKHFETNSRGVFAIGDCAEFEIPLDTGQLIQQLWYSGREQGKTLAKTILGERTEYRPGVFFNSAKFFELEYQTYGVIRSSLSEEATDTSTATNIAANTTANTAAVVGIDDERRRLVRIEYNEESGAVHGFNLMGVRYRQDVCTHWIQQKTSIDTVLQELESANFDPEFSDPIEDIVRRDYHNQLIEQGADQDP